MAIAGRTVARFSGNWPRFLNRGMSEVPGGSNSTRPPKILIVMREDYIAHLDPYLDILPDRMRTRYRLEAAAKRRCYRRCREACRKDGKTVR